MVTDSTEKAEILSKQFKSVFTAEDTSTNPDKTLTLPSQILMLHSTGMRNPLLKSDLNKSAGPDNIYAEHTAFKIRSSFIDSYIPKKWYSTSLLETCKQMSS